MALVCPNTYDYYGSMRTNNGGSEMKMGTNMWTSGV